MRRRRLLSTAAVVLAVVPAVVAAQDWSGEQGFRVLVTDDAGQPVPEVTVALRLAEAGRSGGPPSLLTNESGVVEVTGLSAGEWQVELRRQGFMIVNCYLRLESGKPPEVGFTSSQRTGPFWAPMKVGYSSLGAVTAPARAGSARAVGRAQRRAERREAQREKRLRSGGVARVVEQPAPDPPASEPSRLPADEPVPAPAPTPADVAAVEERPPDVVEAPAPAAPAVTAEHSTEEQPSDDRRTAVEPEPEPEPAPEPEPVEVGMLPNRTLLRAGACPECAPGEWSVSSSWPAEARTAETTACGADLAERMERAAGIVERLLPADFRAYTGALAAPDGNDVLRLLPQTVRAELQELLIPILDPARSCQVVGILLPADARFVGFQYEAADLGSRGGCLPEQPCEVGDARWRGNPTIHRHDHGTLVYGVFENLSPDRKREANLKVYFRPPRGWLPPR